MILGEVLGDEGHEVVTALDGITALGQMREAPPIDLVLLDLRMPGMDGREVIQNMRLDPALQGIPVILVTGAVPYTKVFPPEGTYQGVMKKPFDVADVARQVETLLPPSKMPSPGLGS